MGFCGNENIKVLKKENRSEFYFCRFLYKLMVGQLRQNDRALTYWILRKKKPNGYDTNSHHMCLQICRPQVSVNCSKGLDSAWQIAIEKIRKTFANRLLLLSTIVNSFHNSCWWFLPTRVNCPLHFGITFWVLWFSLQKNSWDKRLHRARVSLHLYNVDRSMIYSRVLKRKIYSCSLK